MLSGSTLLRHLAQFYCAIYSGKRVVVYGRPFYAGWGLTQDRGAAFEADRRKRILSLDELVAGAL